ncbi:unnamed protein product [Rotaria sordida]|uniref:Uncharacterized protein n=1 Tax=Rotaria sordida TaxID=392033 RepID=A0A816CD87_9BILA|nr:unnamed protein product [Rotaria sordida]CAF1623187.1 unnamed protein product [Rotaria sordida]
MTLDPIDWKSTREQAHQMLDIALDVLEKSREKPAWLPLPTEVQQHLTKENLLKEGKSLKKVCEDMTKDVLSSCGDNTHPRFWG